MCISKLLIQWKITANDIFRCFIPLYISSLSNILYKSMSYMIQKCSDITDNYAYNGCFTSDIYIYRQYKGNYVSHKCLFF